MSASTVSITANPAARRRPVVVGEEKSNNMELLPKEAPINVGDLAINNVMGNDKHVASHSKDISHHSIRGEAVLERSSKDLAQVKKNNAIAHSTVSPRRTRLAQMVRRLALKSGDYSLSGHKWDYRNLRPELLKLNPF
ncbi:hypothetical protein GH714_000395 [Hevea brasiliensis]|uniref:Uncharacterized protein n=1 Tax=Hevea brasiliensis TaxID=3981 RepID=A0A6A6LC87_HEVBR|nr:hypothetical protein GH714_000395 [Hevea brasiliensis]